MQPLRVSRVIIDVRHTGTGPVLGGEAVHSSAVISNVRPATSEDSEFCYTLHQLALGPVIAEVFGDWDDSVQRAFHRAWSDPHRLRIIQDPAGERIGVLDVQDQTDHIYLARIEVLPEYQNRGVGTALLRDLLTDRRPIRLHVFTANTRACQLYERLGFQVEADYDGRLAMTSQTG
jgi:ribosomal protein S18 acetylase RimI-like enzyme